MARLSSRIQSLQKKQFLSSRNPAQVTQLIQLKVFEDCEDLARVLDVWRFTITLLYRVTPKQHSGEPLSRCWKTFQTWLPHLQGLLEWIHQPTPFFSLLDLNNPEVLKSSALLIEVIRIHAWYLFEHGRYQEASNMLHTGRQICDGLMRRITNGEDFNISIQTLRFLLSDIRSVEGSIALERNRLLMAEEAFEEVRELRQMTKAKNEDVTKLGILIAESNLAALSAVIGEPEKLTHMLTDCTQLAKGELKDKWPANLALCHIRLGHLDEAMECIELALNLEDDGPERARYTSPASSCIEAP
jgi:tetratricopeptide (TPR) repeat protein